MVTVRLFGLLRLDSGIREMRVEASRVKDVFPLVLKEAERLDAHSALTVEELKNCIAVVNGQRAAAGTWLRDGDTVYLLSPAAGG